jgi:hypothetical protein
MNALQALMAARTSGVEVTVDGDGLALGASAQPPQDILNALARNKAEIIALLKPDSLGWTVDDWRAHYDERAGIIEFDGGLTRSEAEAQAFACCIAEWLNRNPPQPASSTYGCVHCDTPVSCQNGIPLAIPEFAHGAWVHNNCIEAFHANRHAYAVDALRRCGVSAAINAE